MGFSRQEYWSGLPFPSPGDLADPGIKPSLLGLLHWQAGSLPLVPPGKPMLNTSCIWRLPLQHSSPYSYCYKSERRPQHHQTARFNYWVTNASLWQSLKQCKRKYSKSQHLCSSSQTPDCKPSPYESTRLLIKVGHSSWGMSLLCSPLHQLRIKATFLFPPNSL